MNQKRILIFGAIAAVIAVLWYYLKGTPTPQNVSYPNASGGGLPAYQSPQAMFNFGTRQPAPAPSLIWGPPPALPGTPSYQTYNYSPFNLFSLTPDAAAGAVPIAPAASGSCDCGGCCPDISCARFQDGNQGVCLADNQSQQIQGASPDLFAAVSANMASLSTVDPVNTLISKHSLVWGKTSEMMANLPPQGF
jgi:hypothetical protein